MDCSKGYLERFSIESFERVANQRDALTLQALFLVILDYRLAAKPIQRCTHPKPPSLRRLLQVNRRLLPSRLSYQVVGGLKHPFLRRMLVILAFLLRRTLQTVFRWSSWIDFTSGHLLALGTNKGNWVSVDSTGMGTDDEGF